MHAASTFSANAPSCDEEAPLKRLIAACTELLKRHGCKLLAEMSEARGRRDLVFLTQGEAFVLLRCTPRASAGDLRRIAVITAQGPFDRVLLVAASPHPRFLAYTVEHVAADACILAQLKRMSAA